jgi:hypothetical protein
MKVHHRRRKCRHCKQLFVPDPRNRYHQRFCSQPRCQQVRKATQQRVWSQRPVNRDYWRGPEEVERVRQWRRAHPGYWKRGAKRTSDALRVVSSSEAALAQSVKPDLVEGALQVVSTLQPPWVVGLISLVTGATLQADIVATHRRLVARGQEILGMVPGTARENHDAQTTPGTGGLAPTPAPV